MKVSRSLAACTKSWTMLTENEARALGFGQALFALGWSAMWAAALGLLPFVPIGLCLGLMIAGLGLPELWRRRRTTSALSAQPHPAGEPAKQAPARIG